MLRSTWALSKRVEVERPEGSVGSNSFFTLLLPFRRKALLSFADMWSSWSALVFHMLAAVAMDADMLVEDDCTVDTSGSSCSLVAMQLRGKKLSAEAEDTLEQEAHMLADSELAADEERQPYLCMIYPWLPQCAQQHPQTNYAPPPMPPMYNPMYNPMYQPPSPPPYNPMYQPPVMPSPPPYNPMYQPPVMPSPPSYHGPPASTVLSRRGGLDPPASVKTHNGAAWETMRVAGTDLKHIFAIGDWGSLIGVGSGAPKAIIQYRGGHTPGPHTMARHRGAGCTTKDMTACMGATGVCPANCHFKAEIDLHAQSLVATQMKKRAPQSNPDFVLNVGDNFYWGGIETECGHPMGQIHPQTRAQFNVIFEQVGGLLYSKKMSEVFFITLNPKP